MKRRAVALMVCLILALSGCGNAGSTAVATTEPAKEPVVKVEETKPEVAEPETKVEEPTETKEEATESTEAATEPATEISTEEPTQADDQKPAESTESVEVAVESAAAAPTQASGYVIDKYIGDGDFTLGEEEHYAYGAEMGASTTVDYPNHWNVSYYFGPYLVCIGTNVQDPTYCYVAICTVDGSNEKVTYCCLYDYTKSTDNVNIYDNAFVPRETLYGLEKTINYMKEHPDASQKPSIDGMTWIGWDEW